MHWSDRWWERASERAYECVYYMRNILLNLMITTKHTSRISTLFHGLWYLFSHSVFAMVCLCRVCCCGCCCCCCASFANCILQTGLCILYMVESKCMLPVLTNLQDNRPLVIRNTETHFMKIAVNCIHNILSRSAEWTSQCTFKVCCYVRLWSVGRSNDVWVCDINGSYV